MTAQCVRVREPTNLIRVPSVQRAMNVYAPNVSMDADISVVSCEIAEDKNRKT